MQYDSRWREAGGGLSNTERSILPSIWRDVRKLSGKLVTVGTAFSWNGSKMITSRLAHDLVSISVAGDLKGPRYTPSEPGFVRSLFSRLNWELDPAYFWR